MPLIILGSLGAILSIALHFISKATDKSPGIVLRAVLVTGLLAVLVKLTGYGKE